MQSLIRNSGPQLLAAALACFANGAPAMAAFVTFDHRENLNVLNSPDVTIVSSKFSGANNDSGAALRGASYDTTLSGIGWYTGSFPVAEKAVFTIDLGAVRNLKTLRLNGERQINTVTLETSSDGVSWSGPLSHSTNTPSPGFDGLPHPSTFVLDSAVNSRYFRVTGDTYAQNDGTSQSASLNNMRLYGDTGSVVADRGLDLVASTAFTAGAATITSNSGDFVPGAAHADMANDNHADLSSRQLIYSLGAGDQVTASFATTITDIGRVGFTFADRPGASFDTGMHLQVLGSTDGLNFNTVLVDQTGGLIAGPNFFSLGNLFTGNAVRVQIIASAGEDNRISDMFVFQDAAVPEPASLGLLGVGALLMQRRRRLA